MLRAVLAVSDCPRNQWKKQETGRDSEDSVDGLRSGMGTSLVHSCDGIEVLLGGDDAFEVQIARVRLPFDVRSTVDGVRWDNDAILCVDDADMFGRVKRCPF